MPISYDIPIPSSRVTVCGIGRALLVFLNSTHSYSTRRSFLHLRQNRYVFTYVRSNMTAASDRIEHNYTLAPSTSTSTSTSSHSHFNSTIVHVYNKYLIDLVLNHPTLKRNMKSAGHKAIDPMSSEHIDNARRSFDRTAFVELATTDALSDARVLSFEPMVGITVATLCDTDDVANIRRAITSYVYIFATLCATYCECDCESGADAALTSNVLKVLSRIQNGQTSDDELNGIMVDDIVTLLDKVSELTLDEDCEYDGTAACATGATGASATGAEGAEGGGEQDAEGRQKIDEAVIKTFENSKIADLAKEISTEIDMTKLSEGMENPMDMLNFSNLTDSNSVLGSIVGKVGNKIQSKLATGELKHDELLSEAVNLLKAFDVNGANPLLSGMGMGGAAGTKGMNLNMLKKMSGLGGGGNSANTAAARDRIRQKLAKKQAANTH